MQEISETLIATWAWYLSKTQVHTSMTHLLPIYGKDAHLIDLVRHKLDIYMQVAYIDHVESREIDKKYLTLFHFPLKCSIIMYRYQIHMKHNLTLLAKYLSNIYNIWSSSCNKKQPSSMITNVRSTYKYRRDTAILSPVGSSYEFSYSKAFV